MQKDDSPGGGVVTWPSQLTVSLPVVIVALLVAAAVVALPGRPRPDAPGAGSEPGGEPESYSEVDHEGDPGGEDEGEPGSEPEPERGRRGAWASGLTRRLRSRTLVVGGVPSGHDVASAMALLALAYRSGLPTWQVLTAVARTTSGPVARDLRQVATALQWGADEGEAWAAVGEAWRPAARVVLLSHAGGVAPGPLLTTAADDLSRSEIDRLEMAVAQVGVRLVAPLGLVLLPAFCLTTVVPLVVALGSQLLAR